ncbi:MAG: serine/threonine-protein kinase [Nannocystaceae bacterium]
MPELHDSPPPSPSEVKTFIADPSGYAGTAPAEQDGEATLLPGSMLAGRYRVIRKLGAGGMGEVYLAEHVDIEREVAIKTLTARGKKKGGVERFMQEARTASRIRHPNIVDITDFGHTEDGVPFFVMEYLEGVNLATAIRRGGPIPWPRASAIMLQILDALQAAHTAGIIHRDMKPENCFLLLDEGGNERVKLLDFGIAKSEEDDEERRLTQTGVIIGTADYMSPEQARSHKLDVRTDIYSAGVILFEMLTAHLPFTADGVMGVLLKHIGEEPQRPSEKSPEAVIPPAVDELVLRALSKDRDRRFQSAREFAEAVRAADRAPAIAPPVPKPRGRGMMVALALALLAVTVALATTLRRAPDELGDAPLQIVVAGAPDAGAGANGALVDADATAEVDATADADAADDTASAAIEATDATTDALVEDTDAGTEEALAETEGDATETDAYEEDTDFVFDPDDEGEGGDGGPKRARKRRPPRRSGELPERLPYSEFRASLNGARGRANACRTSALSPKSVRLHVSIAASGAVESVKFRGMSGSRGFKSCIEGVVRSIRFGKAKSGQTLGYTFQLS